MLRTRSLLTVCLLLCLCMLHLQASTEWGDYTYSSSMQAQLPHGRELGDQELLTVEGEIVFLLGLVIYAASLAAAGAGAAAVHENWFDEDYGIDADDRRNIASAAISGAIVGATGGFASHYLWHNI
jgi:hypothetical protein